MAQRINERTVVCNAHEHRIGVPCPYCLIGKRWSDGIKAAIERQKDTSNHEASCRFMDRGPGSTCKCHR